MKLENPETRFLYDLKDVLYDQAWLEKAENVELYYIYRCLEKEGDIRYDITVIPAQKLGQEFTKTKGHSHPQEFGELYHVLSGQAFFLLQKTDQEGRIQNIHLVHAQANEYAVVPPGYSHVTINPGQETLKMANWVNNNFQADYSLLQEKKGAAYYYLIDQKWLKNENYQEVPELEIKKALIEKPKDLSFLG